MRGSITLLVLIFGGIFLAVLAALSSYVLSQNSIQDVTRVQTEAFNIAEAGLEYYRWHLAHFPNDLANGGSSDSFNVTIPDPSGGTAGTAHLSVSANLSCGQTTSIDLTSTGTAADNPAYPITLEARYARPSVAAYSYIVNDSVWAGPDRIINGPYHSNGGVRMDGTANAEVTSSVSSWYCDSSFGCSPGTTEPGVFGSGPNQYLWKYPTPQVDFAGIAANFTALKATAQASGIYLPQVSTEGTYQCSGWGWWQQCGYVGGNPHGGYHLIFNSDGTVTVKEVTAETALSEYPVNPTDPSTDYALIASESAGTTYTIPANCGLIFVEDNAWIEGTVPSKVTVVVANTTSSGSVVPDAFIKGNITYTSDNGSAGLTLISEHDILITPDAPTNLTLDGIFVAQSGAFGQNLYACPGPYEPKGTLAIHGSTISYKRTGTQWENGCYSYGSYSNAGYLSRTDSFDQPLSENPPPFTPVLSTAFEFVNWQQL